MPKSSFINPRQAQAHEALFVRLCALLDQLKPLVARHSGAPVSPVVAKQAAEMLGAAAWFAGSRGVGRAPAPDSAGLVAQLTDAKAQLEHFEAQHSAWDKAQNAHVWLLRRGNLPIRRLRPLISAAPRPQDDPAMRKIRMDVERRINAITKGLPPD